jgi:hypothetical protein
MSVIGSNILAGASGQGGDYTIARSLRFRSSASAYLNRTPASAGTSNRIVTIKLYSVVQMQVMWIILYFYQVMHWQFIFKILLLEI